MRWRDRLQELRELGLRGGAYRIGWEAYLRSGVAARLPSPGRAPQTLVLDWRQAPFAVPDHVAQVALDDTAVDRLVALARDAMHGRLLCFGSWCADFGDPIDWHKNPWTGARWDAGKHWSQAMADERRCGDVKLVWEVARFPHAYYMARAAMRCPALAPAIADALRSQIFSFVRENPVGHGVHWASGQEIAFRLMAWVFAAHVLFRDDREVTSLIARALFDGAAHVERHIHYARFAVHNNHLLSEALLLLLAGSLLPSARRAEQWRRRGLALLGEGARRQVASDGAYIQQSHTYHRVALQDLLWAWSLCERAPKEIEVAMTRSLDFLVAHQNPADGRLPNFGNNDGALPSILSVCDYADFRPVLQATSVAVRGERLYPPGPWDEEAVWFFGRDALEAPLSSLRRRSVSFSASGYHVLRGVDPGSFCTFRCGTVRDRFSQIDMLHLDVWWRGVCALGDAGSYLYNGPAAWHQHFFRTASHNTVTVDGHDQMVHVRRFKRLYPTPATRLLFDDDEHLGVVIGEHEGFGRAIESCVHRRSVVFAKADDTWVVVDHITGAGDHAVRLHWLAGDPERHRLGTEHKVALDTERGAFVVAVFDETGSPATLSVACGETDPPRGWVSRTYGDKRPAASIIVERASVLPTTLVSVLSPHDLTPEVDDNGWRIVFPSGRALAFCIADGRATDMSLLS